MSGQCLCSECVEARIWEREGGDDLRGLAAYDQARSVHPALAAAERAHASFVAAEERLDAEERRLRLSARLRAMREARERAGASCP